MQRSSSLEKLFARKDKETNSLIKPPFAEMEDFFRGLAGKTVATLGALEGGARLKKMLWEMGA